MVKELFGLLVLALLVYAAKGFPGIKQLFVSLASIIKVLIPPLRDIVIDNAFTSPMLWIGLVGFILSCVGIKLTKRAFKVLCAFIALVCLVITVATFGMK